jgi:hypothetical protein
MNHRLEQRIDELIVAGGTVKETFDLSRPTDIYILERLSYFRKELPLMTSLGLNNLTENARNNCIIEMYLELKAQGKIQSL